MVWREKTISGNGNCIREKNPALQTPLICKHGIMETTCYFCLGGKPQSNGIGSGPPRWCITEKNFGRAFEIFRQYEDDLDEE